VEVLWLAGWVLLVALTVGPIFSAQKRERDGGWFWIVAALLLGPLAGAGYYMSRYAMRRVQKARYLPKHSSA
jgi:RsiW-degrading membrane proteinase PrsW (M82 family)